MEPAFIRLAEQYGHEMVFHSGHVKSNTPRTIEHLVDRCQIVIITTDVNSHGAVLLARKSMREHGRTPLIVRRLGLSRFEELLQTLEAPAHAA